MSTRPPAVAGMFYPDSATSLGADLDALLAAADAPAAATPRALVVPHAGFVFSGPVAASAYATLRHAAGIRRVVVLGPSHRTWLQGMAVSSAEAFDTPLGTIPLDTAGCSSLCSLPHVRVSNQVHAREHSIEVQLPFLQRVLGDFTLVPVVVGDATPAEVARVIDSLWRDDTLIVVSTDLSHYHDYVTARRIDARTIERILELDGSLDGDDACGCRPLNGLLQVLREKGLGIDLLDARNSGDTAGAHDRVVGYASFAVH